MGAPFVLLDNKIFVGYYSNTISLSINSMRKYF